MDANVKTDVKTGVELVATADGRMLKKNVSSSPYDLKRLQKVVKGYIETVYAHPKWMRDGCILTIVLNEEGKLIGLKDNAIATYFAVENKMIYPMDTIAGDVLFACIDGDEIVPLTDDEANHIVEYVERLCIR